MRDNLLKKTEFILKIIKGKISDPLYMDIRSCLNIVEKNFSAVVCYSHFLSAELTNIIVVK